jgi:hypothetical protein
MKDLEPLATHLESHLGNIYDYPSWTDELRKAARSYLLEVAPEELYVRFLGHIGRDRVPVGSRVDQVDFILNNFTPWGVGAGLHCAAVAITPSFDQLVDQIERVPSAGSRADAALWLTKHASETQIIQMAQDSGCTELLQIKKGGRGGHRNPDAYDLIEALTLGQLRTLWRRVNGASGVGMASGKSLGVAIHGPS